MTTEQSCVPNHHACYPGFAGPAGLLAAASMALGGKVPPRAGPPESALRSWGSIPRR